MTSPPSQSKLTVKQSSSKAPRARTLSLDEIGALEEIHALLLDVQVYVSVVNELEPNKRWVGRAMLLIGVADDLVDKVTDRVLDLVAAAYRRRKAEKAG